MQQDDLEYFKSEEFQEILNQYESSVKSGVSIYMDADDLADIADWYQYNNRHEEAEEAITLAFQYNPEAVGPLLYRAREAITIKDYETALEYASKIEPLDALEAFYLRNEILISEGKEKEADEHFREYLKEVPLDEQVDYVFDVANLYVEYMIYDKAIEWLARSRGDDSDDFKELLARGFFGVGNYKDSERIFNELIDHNPYSSRYWNALASAQFMREDYHAAITSSEFAIAIDPNDTDGLLSKANSLYNLENYESALTFFKKYTEKKPDEEYGYLHQGTCLINLGRHQEAIELLEKGESLSLPDSQYLPEIYQELGFAYGELHQPDSAIYYLDKADLLPDSDHVNIGIMKGHVLLSNKRADEAEEAFREAVLNAEDKAKAMLRVIVSLYDNRFVKQAYILLKRFFTVYEDYHEGYSYMALCCIDLEKDKEFMKYLKLATEKNPKEARLILGHFFPKDMEPKDYYDHAQKQLKKKNKK